MRIFRQRRFRCDRCGLDAAAWLWDTDPLPPCARCGFAFREVMPEIAAAPNVIGDEIPGGVEIRHAICHEDGTPRRFYSKSEIKRVAQQRGWTQDGDTPKPPNCDGFRRE